MKPQALPISLPLLAVRTPIRPVIGRNAGPRRRLPVPLTWRARRDPGVAPPAPQHRENGRLDHFHHWLLSVGIDWRIGSTIRMGSTILTMPVGRSPARSVDPRRTRPAVADRQFRHTTEVATQTRVTDARLLIDRRSSVEHVASHSRTDRRTTENTTTHHGILRHWRVNSHRETSTTILAAPAYRRQPTTVPAMASASRRKPITVLTWPQRSAPVVRQVPSPAPGNKSKTSSSAPGAATAPVSRSAARSVPLVWRKSVSAASPGHEMAAAIERPASIVPSANPVRRAEYHPSAAVTRGAITVASPASPIAPDMNRLVDEVVRRIERQARSERQRRGL